jgi:acyl dehydratase
MPLNPAAVGRRYSRTEPFEVGREHIRDFANAIGDRNPLYHDPETARAAGYPDVIAPPTYLVVLSTRIVVGSLASDPVLGMDYSRVVHGKQLFKHVRPVHVGDTLTVVPHIDSVVSRDAVSQVTLCCTVYANETEHVSTVYSTMVERHEESEAK